jgi:hypothetical protein
MKINLIKGLHEEVYSPSLPLGEMGGLSRKCCFPMTEIKFALQHAKIHRLQILKKVIIFFGLRDNNFSQFGQFLHHDKSVPFARTFKILPYHDNFCNRDSFKISPTANTDGLINWLRQPGQLLNKPPKSMRVNFSPLIKSCINWTDPAAETKSIGLPADALMPCFLLAVWTILL